MSAGSAREDENGLKKAGSAREGEKWLKTVLHFLSEGDRSCWSNQFFLPGVYQSEHTVIVSLENCFFC